MLSCTHIHNCIRSGHTPGDSRPSMAPLVPSRVLLELVEPWLSSFHVSVSQPAESTTWKHGWDRMWHGKWTSDVKVLFVKDKIVLPSWRLDLPLPVLWLVPALPGGHRAADRTAPVAASCTSHLPSHGGPSSWSQSSSASSEDTDVS